MPLPNFIIASTPRSGSWMLATALDQHPQLSMLGEVFNPALSWENSTDVALLQPSSKTPLELVETIYKKFNGFILHHTQYNSRKWKEVHKKIAYIPFRVIWLERKNKTSQVISYYLSSIKGDWHNWEKKYLTNKNSISIPLPAIHSLLRNWKQDEEVVREILRNHPSTTIDYESLVSSTNLVLLHLQEFLGIEYHTSPLVPQTKRTNSEYVISNLDEIEQFVKEFQCR